MLFQYLAIVFLLHFSCSEIIIKPNSPSTSTKLLIFVPGGRVPPENYKIILQPIAQKTNTLIVIIECLLNLCNPFGQIDDIDDVFTRFGANKSEIFIGGHSLGGVCARHYVDVTKNHVTGLILYGTFFTGDDDNADGFLEGKTLGYPRDVKRFKHNLLALTGELDFTPLSFAARLFNQTFALNENGDFNKTTVIVPKMDHSNFCFPFKVSNDIVSELTQAEATRIIVNVTVSWLLRDVDTLRSFVVQTVPMTKPFLIAAQQDAFQWCAQSQSYIGGAAFQKFNVDQPQTVDSDWSLTLHTQSLSKMETTLCLSHQ